MGKECRDIIFLDTSKRSSFSILQMYAVSWPGDVFNPTSTVPFENAKNIKKQSKSKRPTWEFQTWACTLFYVYLYFMFSCVIINHFHQHKYLPTNAGWWFWVHDSAPVETAKNTLMRWHWGDLTQRSLEAPFNKTQFSNWGSQTKTNTHAYIDTCVHMYMHCTCVYVCLYILLHAFAHT